MRKFLIKTTFFIFLPLFMLTIVIVLFSKIHRFPPSNMYYNKEFNNAFYTKKNYDVIAIGNSKLLSSIDKNVFVKKKYKIALLGYSSSDISVSRLTLEAYLNKCEIKPKFVLMEVSWFTFNEKRTTLHGIAGDLFLTDLSLWKHIFKYQDEDIYRKIIGSMIRTLKHYILGKISDDNIDYGKRKIFKSPKEKSYSFDLLNFEKIFPNHIAGVSDRLKSDYQSIVEICNSKQIKLIMYTAPEDEEYDKLQKDREIIKSIFQETTKKYPNIYYLDFSYGGDLWDKKYENWLDNSHHINNNDLFTKELLYNIKVRTHNKKYSAFGR